MVVLGLCAASACAASAGSRAGGPAGSSARASRPVPDPPNAPAVDTIPRRHAAVDLTGTWTTGSTGEPAAERILLQPQCNYSPAVWIIEQRGDSVRAWDIPASESQGIATRQPLSSVPTRGSVSGLDLVLGIPTSRYVLRYDSTSGHLRGTLNGAPFWAVRLEIVHPSGCIPVP